MEQQNKTPAKKAEILEWLAPDGSKVPPELNGFIDPEAPEAPARPLRQQLLGKAGRWLLMVVIFLSIALATTLAGMYASVGKNDLPPDAASFGGVELTPTAYLWEAPVAGPIDRSLEKSGGEPQDLGECLDGHPDLQVPEGLDVLLTLRDEAGEVLFEGPPADYALFTFARNGDYTGTLSVSLGEAKKAASFEPVGHYTYDFRFALRAQPQVTMSRGRITGGSAIGIRVSGLLGQNPPLLFSELGSASFVQLGSDWVAYLPVSAFQQAGEFDIRVEAGDFVTEETVRISYRTTQQKDSFTANGTAAVPYLGDSPKAVKELFSIADPEVYWAENGFIRPVHGKTMRNYESMEYIDRIVDPALRNDPASIAYNRTIPGRHSLNVTFQTIPGSEVICPADGRVIFTGIVGGAGRCIVVEHGCGLKSIFYLLLNFEVSEGDYVPQGTLLGKTQGHTICEVRLGDVPLDPWDVWGGHGGLFFEG